jgi:hypothetical protein
VLGVARLRAPFRKGRARRVARVREVARDVRCREPGRQRRPRRWY